MLVRLRLVSWSAILLACSIARGQELATPWASVRALGMGNAYSAIVEDGDSVFYNPAGLATVTGVYWQLLDPRIGLGGTELAQSVIQASGDTGELIKKLYGKPVWLGLGSKSTLYAPGFAVYGFISGDLGLSLQNPAYPQLYVNYFVDYGLGFGLGFDIIPGIVKAGISARRVIRAGSNKTIGPGILAELNSDAILQDLKNRGTGYAADVGLLFTIPTPVRPSLSVVLKNAGDTSFTLDEGLRRPSSIEQDLTIGAALTVDALVAAVRPAIDLRYANRSDIQLGKKLHMGVEVDLPLLDLRAGFHQGYWTAGVGLDIGLMRIDAASYGVELGVFPGQLEDRRYIVQMTSEFGVDLGIFGVGSSSGKGSGSGSGGSSERRRPKARR